MPDQSQIGKRRLRDLLDFGSTPGSGNDGYSVVYNHTSGLFELTEITGGGGGGDWPAGPEIAITNAATALTVGRLHVITATSANQTNALPAASGNGGKFVYVRISLSTTKYVTIDGNGSETVDGIANWVLWKGESALFLCDGSNWFRVGGRYRAAKAAMHLGAAQSLTHNTMTLIELDTVDLDPAGICDTTNHRFTAFRPMIVECSGQMWINNTGAIGLVDFWKNGSQVYESYGDSASTSFNLVPKATKLISLAAGDYLDFRGYHFQNSGSSSFNAYGDPTTSYTFAEVTEQVD